MSIQNLAAHILRTLAAAQSRGRPMTLETLASALGVRRADVRSLVSRLHREGFLEVQTLRLSLSGFALGSALRQTRLPVLRSVTPVARRAAA